MLSSSYCSSNNRSYFISWIVCLCAGLFFCYELMQFHLLNAISSVLMQDLKISGSHLGLLGSTYLLADVIFLIPAGILLDRLSTKKVIVTALGICICGTIGFAVSTTFLQACISHFLSGIGNAFCFFKLRDFDLQMVSKRKTRVCRWSYSDTWHAWWSLSSSSI